jgi:hypothetical protein
MRRFAVAALLLAACQSGLDQAHPLPVLDEPYFRCNVQPILTQDCGAFACHGDGRRYFRLFGRERLRLGGTEATRSSALTADERASNFDNARGMVDAKNPAASLLLLKPLEQAAGGYYHRGALIFNGGNVFADTSDPDFKKLAAWVNGAVDDPACIEPGSML